MILNDEIYFEITLTGPKSEVKRFSKFLKSGGLEDFFEYSDDFLSFDDSYFEVTDEGETSMTFSTDDYGIELEELDTDEFLEVFCRAARALDVSGTLYDVNDEEYNFKSDAGSSYYIDKSKISFFNEDEDRQEESDDEEEEE